MNRRAAQDGGVTHFQERGQYQRCTCVNIAVQGNVIKMELEDMRFHLSGVPCFSPHSSNLPSDRKNRALDVLNGTKGLGFQHCLMCMNTKDFSKKR